MRKTLILSGVFFLLFFYGLILTQTRISVAPEELQPKNHPGFYDYHGVTNVHSDRSLGSGTPAEIIKAAHDVDLDYIFITDLNVFAKDSPIPEGYSQKLLVMSGNEYSYLDSRLLLYDLGRRHSLDTLGEAQVMLADLLSQSGKDAEQDLIVLAHPSKPGFSWSGPYPSGLDGIEVINLKTIWRHAWDDSKFSFIWSALVYPFNPQLALLRLYDEPPELALWDELASKKQTIGMAGAEATAKTNTGGGLTFHFPSYQTSFSLTSNHVLLRSELTGDAESDRIKILTALQNGQFYFSLDILGNPKGFAAFIQDGDKTHPMGSRMKWAPGMKMIVHLPKKPKVPFEAAFLKDGQLTMSSNSVDTEYEIHGPGVYRVIVRVFLSLTLPDGNRWITWIYSNPFYVD